MSKVRFGTIVNFLNAKRKPLSSKERENKSGIYPYYGASDIVDYIDEYIFNGTYLLISEDGENLKSRKTPIAFIANGKFWVNNHAHIVEGKDDETIDYLKYYFSQLDLSPYITGAVQPKLSKGVLEKIEIDFPSYEIRKSINQILGLLDDKIQLNTQTNQTLEQIAQAIFKSWFVDFDPVRAKAQAILDGKTRDEANLSAMSVISGKAIEDLSQTEYQELWEIADAFPSEFGDEGLPIGWKFNQADNLFEVGIGKTPPRKETEWFSDNANDMEWISIKDMGNQGMFITESGEYLKAEAVDKFNIKKIPKNTVILSFKLTVGRVSITTKETTTNEAIAHFKIPSPSKLSSEFLYCYLKNFDFNNLGSTSSIATAVNSKMIKEMEILEPSDLVVKHFNEYIEGIFNKLRENIIQNNNLAKIRDELLPKLLSGEIDCVQF